MTALGHASLSHAPVLARQRSGFWPLVSLLALVGVGKAIRADTMDPDAFWHLRVADQLLTDGIGPLVDRISFASLKTPWTPYSWLAELLMRGVWAAGGFRAATLVTAACSGAILILIAAAMRERVRATNDLAVVLLTAAAALFTLPFISFRPVTFAMALMAAIVWLLVHDRARPTKWVWAVVAMTAVLTNLHLYSAIVVAMVAATAVGCWFDDRTRFRSRMNLAICVALAACATPMLPGAVTTALDYNAADPMVASSFITEMRPFYSGGAGKASLVLFVAAIGLCVVNRKRLAVTDWLWLAMGTALLWRLGRFSPVFAMLAAPAVARAFPAIGGDTLRRPFVRIALMTVLAAGTLNLLPALGERDFDHWLNRNSLTYPTAAAAYVEQHVRPRFGRLINEFNWGGYLAWRLGGRYQVLMDGRTQLYSPAFWRSTHLGGDRSRVALLAGVEADAAVLPVNDSALAAPLHELGWRECYRDDLAIVLVR